MASDDDLMVVTTATDEMQQSLVLGRLSEAGIRCKGGGANNPRFGAGGPRDVYVYAADLERARAVLKDVKRLGVAIALDNFGAQQSTLSLPGSLPLNMLKLDRTLIQGFERDKERRAMVVATLALARESGLTAVVVGIETNRQLALARELDCSIGQGFLLHKPDAPERLSLREPPGAIRSPPPWRPIVRLRGSSRH